MIASTIASWIGSSVRTAASEGFLPASTVTRAISHGASSSANSATSHGAIRRLAPRVSAALRAAARAGLRRSTAAAGLATHSAAAIGGA